MGERNANQYTNGTAALQMPRWAETPEEAKIIVFPTSRMSSPAFQLVTSEPKTRARHAHATSKLQRILESSEMYCSLKLESMLGCPYNLFTKGGIAVLSAGASAIAIISLILGA